MLITEYLSHIAIITINRPEKHNALSPELIQMLHDAFEEQNNRIDTRVIILKAAGKNFCAGADLQNMALIPTLSEKENWDDARKLADLLAVINHCEKSIITLIHGRVIGGGLGLVALSDIVIASESTEFRFSETALGLIPATIAPYVIRKMGYSAAKRYFLTAENFDAQTALQLDLIHDITTDDALWEKGLTIATSLLKNSPHALQKTKSLLEMLMPITQEIQEKTIKYLANIRAHPEAKDGISAFFEKRTPHWHIKDIL